GGDVTFLRLVEFLNTCISWTGKISLRVVFFAQKILSSLFNRVSRLTTDLALDLFVDDWLFDGPLTGGFKRGTLTVRFGLFYHAHVGLAHRHGRSHAARAGKFEDTIRVTAHQRVVNRLFRVFALLGLANPGIIFAHLAVIIFDGVQIIIAVHWRGGKLLSLLDDLLAVCRVVSSSLRLTVIGVGRIDLQEADAIIGRFVGHSIVAGLGDNPSHFGQPVHGVGAAEHGQRIHVAVMIVGSQDKSVGVQLQVGGGTLDAQFAQSFGQGRLFSLQL